MGTHYKGTAPQIRALNLYIKLLRAADSLTLRLERNLQKHGVTGSQLGVLESIYHLGPLCQKDLGRKLLKSDGNVTTIVDNLEKRYLVQRVRGTEDRRYVTVHLSAKGRTLIEEIFPTHVDTLVEAVQGLNAREQKDLADLCKKLGTKIAAPTSMK